MSRVRQVWGKKVGEEETVAENLPKMCEGDVEKKTAGRVKVRGFFQAA